MSVARQERERLHGRSVATWRARICVTVARQECQRQKGRSVATLRPHKRANGRSVATSKARTCVTVARQECERLNGRSVATPRPLICVTVDLGVSRFAPSPRGIFRLANGASVAALRPRICVTVAPGDSRSRRGGNLPSRGGPLQIPLGSSDPPRGPTGPAHISTKGALRSGHDVSSGLI